MIEWIRLRLKAVLNAPVLKWVAVLSLAALGVLFITLGVLTLDSLLYLLLSLLMVAALFALGYCIAWFLDWVNK